MIVSIWIPGWHLSLLNKIVGHPMKGHRLKSHDADVLNRARLAHGTSGCQGPRRVDLHVIMPRGSRKPDPDAFWKSLLDGLVRCGLLENDSPRCCRLGAVTYSRAEGELWGSLILLEDLP